jgi:hypothetical protein
MLHFELDPRLHGIFERGIVWRWLLQMLPPACTRNDIPSTGNMQHATVTVTAQL